MTAKEILDKTPRLEWLDERIKELESEVSND